MGNAALIVAVWVLALAATLFLALKPWRLTRQRPSVRVQNLRVMSPQIIFLLPAALLLLPLVTVVIPAARGATGTALDFPPGLMMFWFIGIVLMQMELRRRLLEFADRERKAREMGWLSPHS